MSRINKPLWAVLLTVLCTTAVLADEGDRFELSYAKNFNWKGGRVSVDHGFGDVIVDTENGNEVRVRAKIRASDPDFGRQIRVTAVESGNGISVRTEYPERAGI